MIQIINLGYLYNNKVIDMLKTLFLLSCAPCGNIYGNQHFWGVKVLTSEKRRSATTWQGCFLNLFMLVYICAKFGDHTTCLRDFRQGTGTNCPLPVLSNLKRSRKYRFKRKILYLQNLVPAKITTSKVDQKYLHEFFKRKILLSLQVHILLHKIQYSYKTANK